MSEEIEMRFWAVVVRNRHAAPDGYPNKEWSVWVAHENEGRVRRVQQACARANPDWEVRIALLESVRLKAQESSNG